MKLQLNPIKIDDGAQWLRCSLEEAQRLIEERLILPCNAECPKGTCHLGSRAQGLDQVEARLDALRRERSN